MHQDIFTNIFIHTDISTIPSLALNHQLYQWCSDSYTWQLKLFKDFKKSIVDHRSLIQWLYLYYIEKAHINGIMYEEKATMIRKTVHIEYSLDGKRRWLYVQLTNPKPLEKLLPITRHHNCVAFYPFPPYQISFRHRKKFHKGIYDETQYKPIKGDIHMMVSDTALTYYMNCILFYNKIFDALHLTYNIDDLYYVDSKTAYIRIGILATLNPLENTKKSRNPLLISLI